MLKGDKRGFNTA